VLIYFDINPKSKMIKLEIPRRDEANLSIVDKLTELALAHQVSINRKLKKAVLTDGSTQVEGKIDIETYLNELELELHQWWYCAC
jgi:hypothetical protein